MAGCHTQTSPKRKCRHFDEIVVNVNTVSCPNSKFWCSPGDENFVKMTFPFQCMMPAKCSTPSHQMSLDCGVGVTTTAGFLIKRNALLKRKCGHFDQISTTDCTDCTGNQNDKIQRPFPPATLKRKCHFDDIFIIGCAESCQNGQLKCSQCWKCHQNYISASVCGCSRRL